MDIIQWAQEKRERLRAELARIEAFLGTAFELEQEFGVADPAMRPATDASKADAPARVRTPGKAGSGAETLQRVAAILRERGLPMSTKELLPLVRATGIEVGGKDPLATLSARLSQKGVVAVNSGKWWFIEDQQASSGDPLGEEAADTPAKETSAASLFHSDQEMAVMPPP